MDIFSNLDLLSVAVAVAGIAVLGVVILLNDYRSATSRAFFYFAFVSVCWSTINYIYYQLPAGTLALWFLRGVMFAATWHAFTFFHLTLVFPQREELHAWWYRYGLVPLTGVISVLTLTPYVFEYISSVGTNGEIGGVHNGPAIPVFGLFVIGLIGYGIWTLSRKTYLAGKERRPYAILLGGMVATFALLLTFNFLIPAIYNNPRYIPLGALFLLPFVFSSSYAILRYKLFNIRIAAIGVLSFFLSIATVGTIIFAKDFTQVLFSGCEFVLVLVFCFWLIKSVMSEVEQKERIQKLAVDLEDTNKRQEGLIHFISHEVKGYLTKDMGAFAALSEGDFGKLPDTIQPFVERALVETRTGTASVMDILKASNLKKGTVAYTKEPFDFRATTEETVEHAQVLAKAKNLALTFTANDADAPYTFTGDKAEISSHVLRNLIENSINYTPQGSIEVSLKKQDGKLIFAVKDTGIGISDEDKVHLFTEGGHGKDSQKVNVHSTGYGLFIAKNIVVAHGGTIRVDSAGPGKGSTFTVELPL